MTAELGYVGIKALALRAAARSGATPKGLLIGPAVVGNRPMAVVTELWFLASSVPVALDRAALPVCG
ncbi:MAG: hypothetical protein DIU53_010560 [Thermobifida fusca]|uniref:hypothetical protein n=1 Tax=Thermobifida TaxID=83677 RepID=UPI0011AFFE2C|nr:MULTISPECIES: hypothetical protein [Thermobifida]QOS59409.1 hypothetical protein IM867_03010 [Thermobifida fusca]